MQTYTKSGKLRTPSTRGKKPLPPNKKVIQLGSISIERKIADDPIKIKNFRKTVKKKAREEEERVMNQLEEKL